MIEQLNKEQAKEDLLLIAKQIRKASEELKIAYLRISEIYEGI